MTVFLSALGQALRRAVAIAVLVALLTVSNLAFLNLPSYAATMSSQSSNSLSEEDVTERADDESEAAGIQEEIYQQRLQEGQNPEKMPKPYKRIVDAQGKEVPETSLLETTVSKARQLTKKVTGE